MVEIHFTKNAHVILRDEKNGRVLEDRFFEHGTTWETSKEVATRLIQEGVAVPGGPQYTPPMAINK